MQCSQMKNLPIDTPIYNLTNRYSDYTTYRDSDLEDYGAFSQDPQF